MRIAAGSMAVLVFAAACAGGAAPSVDAGPPRFDPITFLELYRSDLEQVLAAAGEDCQRLVRALHRFLAEHREEFLRLARRPGMLESPNSFLPSATIEAWMGFARRCPAEAARLNDALWSMVR